MLAPAALAHQGEGALVLGTLGAASLLYAAGVAAVWRRAGRGRAVRPWQVAAFAIGVIAAAVSLVGPIEQRAGDSLFAHMAQHLLLAMVAAPLLALSRPLLALTRSLPPGGRRAVGRTDRWARGGPRSVVWLLVGTAAAGLVFAAWHVPVLYEAATGSRPVHGFEHLSMFGSALLFWWLVTEAGRRHLPGPALLAVAVSALPAGALAALLTLSPSPWYDGYDLADQQLAGALMWTVGGAVHVTAAAVLLVAWLDQPRARRPTAGPLPREA